MAMQMARARALAAATIAQTTATRAVRLARRTPRRTATTIRAETLPPVSGIGETLERIQDVFEPLAERRGREVEPWQPFGGRRGVPKGHKEYDNVYVQNGRIWAPYRDGTRRMLGYTPNAAKKKYKTKRRRKRLTKRDMYILSVIEKTGQTGLIGMML